MTHKSKPLTVAFSPCPNDIFIFHAWTQGQVSQDLPTISSTEDVQLLNTILSMQKYDVSKASIGCLGKVLDKYILLPTGAALGYGCGPKIIAHKPFDIADISTKTIAIPGKDTTAHLLFNILLPQPRAKLFCSYDEITDLVQKGIVDCGLIIHESRFTFSQQGFFEVLDLGQLWESRYELPLPLGGIFARRNLGTERLQEITRAIQRSLKYAWSFPKASEAYLQMHSQEKDMKVIRQHIDLYVNQESYSLSEKGIASIQKLIEIAQTKGLMPKIDVPWLLKDEEQKINQ